MKLHPLKECTATAAPFIATRAQMKLHPLKECTATAAPFIAKGYKIYQQFNCAKCGTKQTMDVPNKFFTRGICEECKHETNIEHDGCNYMLVVGGMLK